MKFVKCLESDKVSKVSDVHAAELVHVYKTHKYIDKTEGKAKNEKNMYSKT
jgi:hypothetical protein